MIHLQIEHEDTEVLVALEKRFWRIAEAMGCTVSHRKKHESTSIDRESVKEVQEQS